ncbi:hypothetical protein MN116_002280 [Schistosoma mekongi]|uniref:Trematode PH-like domain-containing protein n=1 Tax=Schistosoma mekongi TaxID=38744 RepID=A0AAE1ZJE7_SCHME|nr:hypothetical protein MN116_002280 [Schistosoma mekongi]
MRNKRILNYQQERDYIDDCLRHVGSKQHLFYETHICTIYRVNASPAEHFNETKALYLLEKYRRKRQSHCTGSLLEDRISFERNKASGKIPFRPWVTYKEIKEIYMNRSRPHFFVLCIDSMYSTMRYYEIYKCKIPETAQTVSEYLRRAMNDQDKVLRDLTSIRQVYVDDIGRVRSVSNFELENNRETIQIPESNQNYYAHNNVSPVYLTSPVMVAPLKHNYNPEDVNAKRRTIENLMDVTYITYDPHRGIVTNKNGPVYLYMSRPKSQGTLGNNSIYSDRRSSLDYRNESHHRNYRY